MKGLSIILRTAAGVVAAVLVGAFAWALLPAAVTNGITLYSLFNAKIVVFGGTSILFALYLYRLLKNIDHFSRSKRVVLTSVTLSFLAFFYVVNFRGIATDDTDCQRYNYNGKLNGGIKQVADKAYIVNLCGSGSRNSGFFANPNEQVKLVVTDEHGATLATRLFFVFWGGRRGNEPIEIRDGKLIYFDAADEYDGTRSISMPPTAIDWIAAKIPIWLR